MRSFFYLLPFVGFLSVSCSTPSSVDTPPIPKVTPIAEQPSAQKTIRAVQDVSREADRKAADARAKLEKSQEELDVYQGRVLSLSEMVGALKEAGNVTAANLEALVAEVDFQETHIAKLVQSLKDVSAKLLEEQELRDEASQKLADALAENAKKELEAQTLRVSLSDSKTNAETCWKTAQDNKEAADDAIKVAEREKGARALMLKILIGVGVLLVISAGLNYLQLKGIF